MIVFFLPDLRAGGAERVMLNLLLIYHSKNPNVKLTLLLFKKQGPLLVEVPASIEIHELNTSEATKSVLSFIFFCKKHQPKIVFSSLGASLTAAIARPFISKKTSIINRIGNTIGAEKLLLANPIKRFLYIRANRIIAKMSNHVIFQCHYMAKDYIKETKYTPKQYSVIYNPVQINHIKKMADEKTQRDYTFVAVGRLNPQKDYETLIKACRILKQRNIEFSLAILGDGTLKQKLELLILELDLRENVFLLGHQSNPYPYVFQSNYLVSSSLYEGFSNVIIEAFCLGKPVVATDCPGGNAEVVRQGQNGWLCEYQNPEALADALLKGLLQDVQMSAEQIANFGAELFSDDFIFDCYESIIRSYI